MMEKIDDTMGDQYLSFKMISYSHLKILFSKTRPEVISRLEILKKNFKEFYYLDLSKNGQYGVDLKDIKKYSIDELSI